MSEQVSLWAPVVVGRTFHSDTWWRAQPTDLDAEWRGRLWQAVLGRGQAHRLQEGSRFLLARSREGRVFVAVAAMTAEFAAEYGADVAGRPLHGLVGWLSQGAVRPEEIPALGRLAVAGRAVAGEEFASRMRDIWKAPDGFAMTRPVTSEYGPAPWAGEPGPGEGVPEPYRPDGHVAAWPAERAGKLWSALAASAGPYTLVVGWPSAGAADLSVLTHLTAADIAAETALRVPEPPRARPVEPPAPAPGGRGSASGEREGEAGETGETRPFPGRWLKVGAAGAAVAFLLLPLPPTVKIAVGSGVIAVVVLTYPLIRRLKDLLAGLRGGADRPVTRPAGGTPSGARPSPGARTPAADRWTVRPRRSPARDTEELI